MKAIRMELFGATRTEKVLILVCSHATIREDQGMIIVSIPREGGEDSYICQDVQILDLTDARITVDTNGKIVVEGVDASLLTRKTKVKKVDEKKLNAVL